MRKVPVILEGYTIHIKCHYTKKVKIWKIVEVNEKGSSKNVKEAVDEALDIR